MATPILELAESERTAFAALMDVLQKEFSAEWIGQRVALTILFCSKCNVQDATKRYQKWVKMLQSFGFASLAELLGPAAMQVINCSGDSPAAAPWSDDADWRELRADAAAHGYLLPAGNDGQGRQVLWQLGVMTCDGGREREQAVLRVITLAWLAVHSDLTTLREGVIVVHMVQPNDGSHLTRQSTRKLVGAAGSFPARPQKVLIAGLGATGIAIARTLIRLVFAVTRTKLLDRMMFVTYPELWEHVPHRSIPKLHGVLRSGGAYSGLEHPIDWIEQRLRAFGPLEVPPAVAGTSDSAPGRSQVIRAVK